MTRKHKYESILVFMFMDSLVIVEPNTESQAQGMPYTQCAHSANFICRQLLEPLFDPSHKLSRLLGYEMIWDFATLLHSCMAMCGFATPMSVLYL